MPNPKYLAVLAAALHLPLKPQELALLRLIHMAAATGRLADFGNENAHREQEITDLFDRCQKMLRDHVSQVVV